MAHRQSSIDLSVLPASSVVFTNCRLCIAGTLTAEHSALIVSKDGSIDKVLLGPCIVPQEGEQSSPELIDLQNAILAPGLLELQTNGMRGFHFTHFESPDQYASKVDDVARYLPSQGVTGFWATIPTVASDEFKKILPHLTPRLVDRGASLLGAHAEGPYLHSSKKGAHNSALFHEPATAASEVYGEVAKDNDKLKLITVAPELENVRLLIAELTSKSIRVSLGHSSASYADGVEAIRAGASCLTHTLNAMAPLHHRDPGLAGLATAAPSTLPESPYFSIIPDGNHLHPSVAIMLFKSNMQKCIFITDSIELAGLDDGTYPGHSQIPFNQTKKGSKVVIEGTDTLIGGCAGLSECVRNMMVWSGCDIAQAARCVTENVVDFMGQSDRGRLEVGRRADLVVMDDQGNVKETWIGGQRVFRNECH